MIRCKWCNIKNDNYVNYHDNEWGVYNLDDSYLFEMLILEMFQAGLNWECILNKRENFRKAYCNFDIDKIVCFGEEKINELMNDRGIIRNERKIRASIVNAKIFKNIQEEFGTFGNYLLLFTDNFIVYETEKTTNSISDSISFDLKLRGMKFVGSTIIYSYLQAVGIIYSHERDCFLYKGDWFNLFYIFKGFYHIYFF